MRIRSMAAVTVLAVTGGASALTAQQASAELSVLNVDGHSASCKDAAGSGTDVQPFCTVQAAANLVQPGQTVDIVGAYTGTVKITQSGTPQAPITFTSHTAAIQGGAAPALDFEGVHDVAFSGTQLTSTGTTPAVEINNSSDITVGQEEIGDVNQHTTAPLIAITGTSGNVTLTRDNLVGFGTVVSIGSGISGTTLTDDQMLSPGGPAVVAADAPNTIITSDTVKDPCSGAIELTGASTGAVVENDIITTAKLSVQNCTPALGSAEINLDTAATGARVDYNIVNPPAGVAAYSVAGTAYQTPADLSSHLGQGAHDLETDPQFLGGSDYLSMTSPAIDSADASAPGEPAADYNGNPRVDDPQVHDSGAGTASYYDRGAEEFQDPFAFNSVGVSGSTTAPGPVTATANVYNPWNDQVSYTFDFGDHSTPVTTTSNSYQHAYPIAGTYPIQVTATRAGSAPRTVNSGVVVSATLPATKRWDLLARDASGALWQFQGSGNTTQVLGPRQSIAGDFSGYTALATLGGERADGTGSLVARDAAGDLWLFPGTGNAAAPFGARVHIGHGWNGYTSIVGIANVSGTATQDLLARDSAGYLWLYPGTGNPAQPFLSRVRVGHGWNGYNAIVGAGDFTGSGHSDVLARDTNGYLWLYPGTGNPAEPFLTRVLVGHGWNGYTSLIATGDLDGSGHPALLARDASGDLWLYQGRGTLSTPFAAPVLISSGWGAYNAFA